jgi:pyruvate-ferredoxin/flavodoxin oxidoreductase
MQSAFFKIAEVIPYEQAVSYMKKAALKSYGKKGEKIVNMNYAAIDAGGAVTQVEVLPEWKNIILTEEVAAVSDAPDFVKNIVFPVNALQGDFLKVSAFKGREDGTFENGTAAYEKRGIAVAVPEWVQDTCTQCNQCAYVCPHACIRPFLMNANEMANAPEGTDTKKAIGKGLEGLGYRIQVSPLDCTGCGNCVEVCPAPKSKALVMKPLESQGVEIARWNYFDKNVSYKETLMPKEAGVKNSQFAQPLFEFSGACAGCGETPYIKLITQLYGERMMIANATGCSSIYGGSAPSTPYTTNKESGKGPAWANSLFEDNAEYGMGMAIATNKLRDRIALRMREAIEFGKAGAAEAAFKDYLEFSEDGAKTEAVSAAVLAALEGDNSPLAEEIRSLKQYLVKKSVWVFGGDGWAYDIGYGGLDHVLASGMDINVLVMDTEVYSNTGGQSSKSTPVGAVAKFAAAGKRIRKKDLGMMAMSYGYVYVAQVAMGANQNQYMKALKEAEAYKGPSLIIAYSPCINHGLKAGMGATQAESKKAVEAGYWHLYRFNPDLEAEGKNPFTLDSKEPDWTKFQGFLAGEVRYTSLQKAFPEAAHELFVTAESNAKWRYNQYKRLSQHIFEPTEVKE